jgi:intein/homing endonuclease
VSPTLFRVGLKSKGAFATQYFILFNPNVASSITAQGRDLTKAMDIVNENYWYGLWIQDKELHKRLCIKDVKEIPREEKVSIYADTDSVHGDSLVRTTSGIFKISDWYNSNIDNGSGGTTLRGHESVLTGDKILNWGSSGELEYVGVKRIIRHQVTKPMWRLKTSSGREIIVTGDHSMIVFRDGIKLEVKPSEILKTDKVLTIIKNKNYENI